MCHEFDVALAVPDTASFNCRITSGVLPLQQRLNDMHEPA
jgi:hypothetical protein